jgi:type II secretory pathway component GspD/PulD (secretin)
MRSFLLTAVTALSAIALTSSFAYAQTRGAPRYEIDVEADDEDLAKVMADISRQTGKTILVHPDVKERVTISLRRCGWRSAVSIIAEFTGCKVERYPGGILNLKKPRTVSLQFTDANVRTVLLLLANHAGANIILGPDVTGTVTLDVRDVDYLAALKAVVETAGQGRYVVVGTGGERPFAVGDVHSEAPAPATPKVETVEGRLVSLGEVTVTLRPEGGKRVELALPGEARARARVHGLLSSVPEGGRVVVTVARRGNARTVQDVIAQGR